MKIADALTGFYAVLDRDDLNLARTLLAAGAKALQIRIKPEVPLGAGELVRIARACRQLCDEAGAALIVNDRIDVALAAKADGVHLGQTDLPLREARRLAGARLWIGISTHHLAQVTLARAGGADYLGFGPVFLTRTKKNPDPVQGLTGLRAAVKMAGDVPVVAIGGIAPENAPGVYATGAAAICAIGSVNDSSDVMGNARRLHRNSGS